MFAVWSRIWLQEMIQYYILDILHSHSTWYIKITIVHDAPLMETYTADIWEFSV